MAVNLASNLHPKIAKHIDERFEVQKYSDLNSKGPLHRGMIRYVVEEDKHYRRTASGAWVPFGDGGTSVPGQAATVQVGLVELGDEVSITNVGTPSAAVLNFILPRPNDGWVRIPADMFCGNPEFNTMYEFIVWVLQQFCFVDTDFYLLDGDESPLMDGDLILLIE